MREIPLSQGKVALVDDIDFVALSQWKWYAAQAFPGKWYAARNGGRKNGKRLKPILMHRVILNDPVGMQVDHVNGNGLDNRRENIRVCSCSENQRNMALHVDSSTGFKGVYFKKGYKYRNNPWDVRLNMNGKRICVGAFPTKEQAALAYNKAASELFGEFAYLNVVGEANV